MCVTPTGNRLVAREDVKASYAPWLTCISPFAKLSLWAIHFFIPDTGRDDGMNMVKGTVSSSPPSMMAGRMPSRLPLAIYTAIPSDATLRAVPNFDAMPPRPSSDLMGLTNLSASSSSSPMTGITCDA